MHRNQDPASTEASTNNEQAPATRIRLRMPTGPSQQILYMPPRRGSMIIRLVNVSCATTETMSQPLTVILQSDVHGSSEAQYYQASTSGIHAQIANIPMN